jgi:small subunit ribosomal protein S6
MAYEIKKRVRGHYTRLDYCAPGSVVDEMERQFRIDDRVLKYLTVMTDEDPDVERIQAEMAGPVEEPVEAAEDGPEAETPSEEESPAETVEEKTPETESRNETPEGTQEA